jgi:hypothetical protein
MQSVYSLQEHVNAAALCDSTCIPLILTFISDLRLGEMSVLALEILLFNSLFRKGTYKTFWLTNSVCTGLNIILIHHFQSSW